jgi:hypothetical protein
MYDIEKLRPIALDDLIRIGQRNDGGYVLPRRAIAATNILLSFGISSDWRFEEDFLHAHAAASPCSASGTQCRLFAFDASVSAGKLCRESLQLAGQSLSKILRFDFTARRWGLLRMKKAILFPLFFNQRERKFFPLFLGAKTEGKFVNFDHVFHEIIGTNQLSDQTVFLKMDIEGAEYGALPLLMPYLQKINAMVFEFHYLDRFGEELERIVDLFSERFVIAHVHANNYGGFIRNSRLPITLEISFLNKGLLKYPPEPSRLSYPVPGLDSPCNPHISDLPIPFDSGGL